MNGTAELLAKRRNRVIAVLLSFKEREIDGYLPVEAQGALRKMILDQINDLTEFATGLVGTPETPWVANDLYLQKLAELQNGLEDLRQVVTNGHGAGSG